MQDSPDTTENARESQRAWESCVQARLAELRQEKTEAIPASGKGHGLSILSRWASAGLVPGEAGSTPASSGRSAAFLAAWERARERGSRCFKSHRNDMGLF